MWAKWSRPSAAGLAIGAVALAVVPFLGAGCHESSSFEVFAIFSSPFVLGFAGFIYVTRDASRWWWGIVADIAVTLLSAVLLALLLFAQILKECEL